LSKPPRDIVRDIIERLMAHEPSITEEIALRVEAEVRQTWGGAEVYVPKEAKRQSRVREAVVKDALSTMSTAEIQRRHGVSRATIYRLLKRGPGTDD
jgi:Mor family transcriptional regulator